VELPPLDYGFSLVPFYLSCGSLLCALTAFHTQPIFCFGHCNIQSHTPPPQSLHTQSHLYPSHDTYTYYTIHTTHASILFASTPYPTVSHSSQLSMSRFVLHSLFSRSFRSFCPNPFLLLALACLFPHALAFCQQFDLCSPSLSLSFPVLFHLTICSAG
jgi:hypothetical protein